MEGNVEETEQPSPIKDATDKKQKQNVEHFKYFGGTITYGARCAREMTSGISMAEGAFSKMKAHFTRKLN
jgi:hypothetical protein